MENAVHFQNISIVLKGPRYPENIGAAARAMMNMGMTSLLVVSPENPDPEKMFKMATHKAAGIVREISFHDHLKDALAPFSYVAGATARLGGERKETLPPWGLASRLAPISHKNRIALLFGPEDTGLSNEDIRLCHALVNIPTQDFSSLNLAQAVMVICYEISVAARKKNMDHSSPRLASVHELEGMYEHLEDSLSRIDFINAQNPDHWMNNLRRFFQRLPLRAKEARIIRGICRQINWYGKKSYQDGLSEFKTKKNS